MLLRVRQYGIRQPFGIGRGQSRVTGQRRQVPVNAHLRSGVCREVEVGASRVGHLLKKLWKSDLRRDTIVLLFHVNNLDSIIRADAGGRRPFLRWRVFSPSKLPAVDADEVNGSPFPILQQAFLRIPLPTW